MIDGSKALRKGIRDVFGSLALVQRCPVHKRRNVLDHHPKIEQAGVRRALDDASNATNAKLANGRMILRWTGAAILEVQRGFRRVKVYRDMHTLVAALEGHEEGIGLHAKTKAA